MCFLDNLLLGDERDLIKWAKDRFSFTFVRPQSFYKAVAEDDYAKHLRETGASPQRRNDKGIKRASN